MSRSWLLSVFLWLTTGSAAPAQDGPPEKARPSISAEEVIANAREAYGPPAPKPACEPQQGDEIVVCAKQEDQEQFRVKSSSELDPTAEESIDDGLPRAPDVGGPGIFKGPATVSGLCFIPPCPKPPAVLVDFSALPETPPGSDADRVGRGLAPIGNETGVPETPAPGQDQRLPSAEDRSEATDGSGPNRR